MMQNTTQNLTREEFLEKFWDTKMNFITIRPGYYAQYENLDEGIQFTFKVQPSDMVLSIETVGSIHPDSDIWYRHGGVEFHWRARQPF